jgi:hypothetical protein
VVAAIVVAVLLLSGGPDIVGTWVDPENPGDRIVFSEGGTGQFLEEGSDPQPFTWSLEGESVTITTQDGSTGTANYVETGGEQRLVLPDGSYIVKQS